MTYELANVVTVDGSFATVPDEVFITTVRASIGPNAADSLVVFNDAVPVPLFDSYLPILGQLVNEIVCAEHATMAVHVFNPPAEQGSYNSCALTRFEVWATFSPGGRPMRVMYSGPEYTDPKFPCLYASETPTALQADNQSWFMLDVTAFYSVKFLIVSNADVARTCQIAAVMKKGSAAGSFASPIAAAP